jgi:excisionase family DNA binding protein
MADELLTVKEVAARLKLNPQTVRRWIRSGRLRGVRVGTRGWRVKAEEVLARSSAPAPLAPEGLERRQALMERFLALREKLREAEVSGVELSREARRDLVSRELSASKLPPMTPEQLAARERAVKRLLSLRAAFARPGPSLQEILDEERREQEED